MARDPEAGKPKPRKRSSSSSSAKTSVNWRDVREILLRESHENLVRALVEWGHEDKALRDRLLSFAARRVGPAAAVAEAARAMENAVGKPGRYIAYRDAREWARNVNRAIDNIEQLLVEGHCAAVAELCEDSLHRIVSAVLNGVDDSDGHFAGLRDRLEALHLRACELSGPDPVELAQRLFECEATLDFDVFYDAAKRYAHLLQAEGLRAYRRCAEAAWAALPKPAEKNSGTVVIENRRILRIMERLARESGDTEALVAVLSRDLSYPRRYGEIAKVYEKAGQPGKALEWIERGLKAFPEHANSQLPELAAELYQQLGRPADAMKLVWRRYLDHPSLARYQVLQEHAARVQDWPQWRERALAEIRSRISKAKMERQPWGYWVDHTLLVEIFLFEGDSDAAWREARIGGCSTQLLLRLAALREKDHPGESGEAYLRVVEGALAAERNGRYEAIVDILRKAGKLMRAAGRNREFLAALYGFNTKYYGKRNFTKLVNERHKELFGE